MNTVELTVIIPAWKEAENLKLLLPKVKETCSSLTSNYEILVVDVPTPVDETPEVCKANGVNYLNRKGSSNYGDAFRTGIHASKGEYVVNMDADISHIPVFIKELWLKRQGSSLVIASRYMKGGGSENPWHLVFMSRCLNVVYRLVLGLNIQDISNSFRLYEGDALRSLSVSSDHFDIVEEILIKMKQLRGAERISELPYHFRKRKFGETKRDLKRFIISLLKTLVRLRRLNKLQPAQDSVA